uniref:hypothetical protein n=1 Tax=Sphingomonas sp. CFBP 13720 TaxID=2775302 RepID=UPI0031391764
MARARAVVGCRFRAQGRDPAGGLDCIGLVGWALGVAVPAGYPLRCDDAGRMAAGLLAAGLWPVAVVRPGDVLVLHSAPGQLHLAIGTGDGIVHADAVARRVVERPGTPPWPVAGIWRSTGEGEDGDDRADGSGGRAGRADRGGDRCDGGAGGGQCAVRIARGGRAAAERPSGTDVELWHRDPETVRDDPGGGDGHLGD